MEPTQTKKPNFIKVIIFILVVVGALILSQIAFRYLPSSLRGAFPTHISANILYLTSPVLNFSGQVEKVSGDSITVSQEVNKKKITFKVKVSKNTVITKSPESVPYLFKTINASPSAGLKLGEIKVGDLVDVHTNTDLRTIDGDSFEAVSVSIQPNSQVIRGSITNVTDKTVTVKGNLDSSLSANSPGRPAQKELTLTLLPDSEIVRLPAPAGPRDTPKVEKLSGSDLKKDQPVTVYFNQISSNQLMALLVIVSPNLQGAPVSPASASASATPKLPVTKAPSSSTNSAQPRL